VTTVRALRAAGFIYRRPYPRISYLHSSASSTVAPYVNLHNLIWPCLAVIPVDPQNSRYTYILKQMKTEVKYSNGILSVTAIIFNYLVCSLLSN
jgi:hypothetical protein